jgi:hypothetical protein
MTTPYTEHGATSPGEICTSFANRLLLPFPYAFTEHGAIMVTIWMDVEGIYAWEGRH